MAQYIEREAAIAAAFSATSLGNSAFRDVYDTVNRLRLIPSADVQPVVRCKECQDSYEWANVDGDNYRYCGYLRDRWNHDYDRMVDDDDFCKWGRKMDGGET